MSRNDYNVRLGKFIALVLRHHPEKAGITLDKHGWADVDELINGINEKTWYHIDRDILDEIVRTNNKHRYSYNSDKTKIRANQGHSIPVDIEMPKTDPPDILYHGTGENHVKAIDNKGLLPMNRLYVHLSKDIPTAVNVGSRHGKPVVYEVAAGKMAKDGYDFYLSVNGIWQTKKVPRRYLKKLPEEEVRKAKC